MHVSQSFSITMMVRKLQRTEVILNLTSLYVFYLAMRNKYFFHQNMFLYCIRGLLHPHCYTDHYVMQEQPSFQYYELVFITCTCTTVQTQFYIGKIVFQHVLPWWMYMYHRVFPRWMWGYS